MLISTLFLDLHEDLFAKLAGGKLDLSQAACSRWGLQEIPHPRVISIHPVAIWSSFSSGHNYYFRTLFFGVWMLHFGLQENESRKVLKRLQEHSIRVKKSNCTFMKLSIQYLGNHIDMHWRSPCYRQQARGSHWGTSSEKLTGITILSRIIKLLWLFSSFIHPLNKLLQKDSPLKWTKECE